MDTDFTTALRAASTAAEAAALIAGEAEPETPGAAKIQGSSDTPEAPEIQGGSDTPETPAPEGRPFRIVAVTSCPTGIAHTYMAAESLEKAGHAEGVEVVVETQGSAGFTRLDPAVIAAADGVVFAHDVPVRNKERFAGKPTVDVGVKAGINRAAQLIAEVREKAARGEITAAGTRPSPVEAAGSRARATAPSSASG